MAKNEMNWIVYLADGRKILLTEKEFEKISKRVGEFFLDGVEITDAVREDCNSMFPFFPEERTIN